MTEQPRAALLSALAPHILAFIVAAGFIALTTCVLFRSVPESPIVSVMLGALGAGFSSVLSFYFGSSQGSRAKDVTIAQSPARGEVPK
jgi:hypothetical protein